MSRSKWKGPYIDINGVDKMHGLKKDYITSRNTTIVPKFVESTFKVYNGHKFNEIHVTEEMIGHKFGEFSTTRKRFSFKKKKK